MRRPKELLRIMTAYRAPPRQVQCAAPLHRWHPVRAWRWWTSRRNRPAVPRDELDALVRKTTIGVALMLASLFGSITVIVLQLALYWPK
jgi:hypothetical protein